MHRVSRRGRRIEWQLDGKQGTTELITLAEEERDATLLSGITKFAYLRDGSKLTGRTNEEERERGVNHPPIYIYITLH